MTVLISQLMTVLIVPVDDMLDAPIHLKLKKLESNYFTFSAIFCNLEMHCTSNDDGFIMRKT